MEGGSEAHKEAADPVSQLRPRFLGSIHQMHLQAEDQTAMLAQATSLKPFLKLLK